MVNMFYYLAVNYIPLSFVASVSRPGSLILLMFFERIFLKSSITIVKIVAMVLCIIGIVITIQPWIDPTIVGVQFENNTEVCDHNSTLKDSRGLDLDTRINMGNETNGSLDCSNEIEHTRFNEPVMGFVCVALNIGFMVAMMIYQRYKLLEVDGLILVFWSWVVGTVVSGAIMFAFEYDRLYVKWTMKIVLLACGHGFAACFFTIFNLLSNLKTSSLVVQLASSLQIVFMLIGQYTVLVDINPGHYNALEVIGVLTILVGSFLVPLHTVITKKSPRH